MRKKSIETATTLIKKVKSNLLDVLKLRAEIEKILAESGHEDFAELKLNEWENYEFELIDHFNVVKEEI